MIQSNESEEKKILVKPKKLKKRILKMRPKKAPISLKKPKTSTEVSRTSKKHRNTRPRVV